MCGAERKFRCASTVILAAPKLLSSNTTKVGTFMVQRAADTRFMPNSMVFPGGEIHSVDFHKVWEDHFAQVKKAQFKEEKDWLRYKEGLPSRNLPRPRLFEEYRRNLGASQIPPDWAFKVCGLRELYEEAGILALYDRKEERTLLTSVQEIPDKDARKVFVDRQEAVRNNAEEFLNIFADGETRYSLAFWVLKEWSNWLTPAIYPDNKRFDTIFYIFCADQETKFSLCSRELQHAEWCDPLEVLKRAYKGEQQLPPPQVLELSRLAGFSELDRLRKFAEEREEKGIDRLCPQIILTKDGNRLALLPGDSLYEEKNAEDVKPYSSDETLESLRESSAKWHRTEFRPKDKKSPWTQWRHLQKNLSPSNGHIVPLESPQ